MRISKKILTKYLDIFQEPGVYPTVLHDKFWEDDKKIYEHTKYDQERRIKQYPLK